LQSASLMSHLDTSFLAEAFSSSCAFVLSVGLACLYGALLAYHGNACTKLQTVWLLTALTRASVATFVIAQVLVNTLEAGWLTVAVADGACVVIQAIGLRRGWLARASS
jgi:uncharacterized membrane protein